MAARDHTLSAWTPSRAWDEAGTWFWQFLKTELAPYPGRAWVVGRITIAATITMILVMTFRIPYGFLGAIYTMFLSRENPTVTFLSGAKTAAVYAIATLYTFLCVMTLVADPLTHFLWITASIFLAFYLIRIVPDYFTAVGFGFTLAGVIPLWDETYLTLNQRTENTLWLGFVVVVGASVTVAVEYVFRRVHPITDLTVAIDARLRALEDFLRELATIGTVSEKTAKANALFSATGTSRMRRQLLRSGYPAKGIGQMNAAVALLGRLNDLAATVQSLLSTHRISVSDADRARCLRLANQVSALGHSLQKQELPSAIDVTSHDVPSDLPLLVEMERTVALIPQAFSGAASVEELFSPSPVGPDVKPRMFVADAFSNIEHLKFAVRGTLATMLAYVVYKAIDYPALSTAVATCIITALSTIGGSRQKQFLRLGGAILGGFVCGMGSQVFILPFLDSITGFTLLFATVTAISAWIATATPRLSYLGIQMALAFYLINLQEFAIQSSLSIARDRVLGVLLGLFCMWLVFDRLWVRDALQEVQEAFARCLRLLAELMEVSGRTDRVEAAKRVVQLRDQINDGFNTVKSQQDAVLFELGPSRQRKLKIREDLKRWQPALATIVQMQITRLQYLTGLRSHVIPQPILDAQAAFEADMGKTARTMSEEVSGKVSGSVPDVNLSAATLLQHVQEYYSAAGSPIPMLLTDMMTLSRNLAATLAPLHEDIHATFADPILAAVHNPEIKVADRTTAPSY